MKRLALIVDDEIPILTALAAILEDDGFEVHTASSAANATEKMSNIRDFDLVITDLRMESDTAGDDVIRAANRLPRPPVTIIMSAYSSLKQDWKTKGADAAFDKPANVPELLRTIDTLLAKRDRGFRRTG